MDGLRNRLSSCQPAKRSFEDLRSQAGAWERVKNRNARCAPLGQPGQPITKPLFRRRFDWLARSSEVERLGQPIERTTTPPANQQPGSGVPISKLAPSAPSIPVPSPRPILKFEDPTPIQHTTHPKNASAINQAATAESYPTPQPHVKSTCRIFVIPSRRVLQTSSPRPARP